MKTRAEKLLGCLALPGSEHQEEFALEANIIKNIFGLNYNKTEVLKQFVIDCGKTVLYNVVNVDLSKHSLSNFTHSFVSWTILYCFVQLGFPLSN